MTRLKLFLRKYLWWIVLAPIALIILVQGYFFAQIWWWVDHNPTSTSFMRQQLSELQEKNPKAKLKHQWVPYSHLLMYLGNSFQFQCIFWFRGDLPL